jgi:PilZ domain
MPSTHHDVVSSGRKDARIIVNIGGHFSILQRRMGGGARPVFACRAVNVSNREIALISPVGVEVGGRIRAEIDHLGTLEGTVVRTIERGFVMGISASDEERAKLDDKIAWLERYKNLEAAEQRTDPRFAPARRRTKLLFSDGTTMKCTIVDVSASGAAISAETIPQVGTVLAIGTIVGRVVRHFEGGFGVKFIERQSDGLLEENIRPIEATVTPAERAPAAPPMVSSALPGRGGSDLPTRPPPASPPARCRD